MTSLTLLEGAGAELAFMLLEATCVVGALCVLLRLRPVLGLAPVYTTLGVLYHLAGFLAGTMYVRIAPGLAMSPGSVVLFPANLFVVLFVYVNEDALEARRVIYGLFVANLVAVMMGVLISHQLASPLVSTPQKLSPDLFLQQPRIALVGAAVLYFDTIEIVLVYEWLRRTMPRPRLVAICGAMLIVLALDTLLFVTGSFGESPAYGEILISGMVGKTAIGLFYALVLSAYLHLSGEASRLDSDGPKLGDMLQLLTYRKRYEELRDQVSKDALTDLHNRRFFDETLARELATAKAKNRPLALLMIDVDHFKKVNDTAGHPEGDHVLQSIARTLTSIVRSSDHVCRYGGEEFAVILPDTRVSAARGLASRIREAIADACTWQIDALRAAPVTVTIGIADSVQAADFEALIKLADRRLYAGKRAGRNRVVSDDTVPA